VLPVFVVGGSGERRAADPGRMDPDSEALTFSRDVLARGEDPRELARAVARGRLVRVRRGAYLPAARWQRLGETERYTLTILAAIGSGRVDPVISHISAAVLWGAPVIGPMPKLVHMLATEAAGTRTEHGCRKHATRHHDDLEVRGGLRMTSLVRTLADVAVDCPFVTAVGILDWAFAEHGLSAEAVLEHLRLLGVSRGLRRAERAIRFADGRSGSPGESLSRVRMHEAGLPAPELQHEFRDSAGLIGIVDFWWPEFDLVGEFDGVAKYVREEFRAGRDIADIVIAEKRREDRIRALGPRFARWGWDTAWPPYRLAAVLREAGLPATRRV